jgi:cytochrome o ubiquinol oxidase operon protein cyoD
MSEKHIASIPHGNLMSYIFGFLLSVILTLSAYILAQIHITSTHEIIPHEVLIPLLIGLAMVQLCVQLIFFLHLFQESKPRWNFLFFVGTFMGVLLVVVMSLWIMDHLNYNMTPDQMKNQILHDEGIHY